MSEPFTDAEIEQLTNEINSQLMALTAANDTQGETAPTRAARRARGAERQRQIIAQATGQDAGTFLARFHAAARKDLCEPGGLLHAQWQKFRDLASKDMLKTFGGILVGLGLAGSTLAVVVVAVSVYVLYLGVEAFCAAEG